MSDPHTTGSPTSPLSPDAVVDGAGQPLPLADQDPAARVRAAEEAEAEALAEVESPAKIIRIGAMVKQMLEEVRSTELDESARDQLRTIYERSVEQLSTSLSPDLADELRQLTFDFSDEEVPTEAELRLAQAQLVGWLEGLFHGIQATLVAQQMAARQQLEGVRGQLGSPPGGPGYI
ncbi:MAG: proteasome activator [Actinomycetes bacterium]